jgi:Ca2+-binding RTX toxin-like protein
MADDCRSYCIQVRWVKTRPNIHERTTPVTIGIPVIGDGNANHLYGTVFNDTVNGLGGNDSIFAGDGDDLVLAGDGNDVVYNDYGNDTFYGGAGNDTISFAHIGTSVGHNPYNSQPVIFDLSIHTQFVSGFGIDEYWGFENVEGGFGSDILSGDKYANKIYGSGGDDLLFGRDGNDIVEGGMGADVIEGGKGADKLYGFLPGGGDGQSDTFRYNSVYESGTTKDTRDTIYGYFKVGGENTDKIDLHLIDGPKAMHFIGSHSFDANSSTKSG